MPPKAQPPSREILEMFGAKPKAAVVKKSLTTQTTGEIKAVLPYPPSANRYWRKARGMVYVSAEAKAYKKAVSSSMPKTPFAGPVSVTIDVYRPARRGDLDNCIKILLDSLNGIAYADDQQIIEIHAERFEDKKNPRVEVTISQRNEL